MIRSLTENCALIVEKVRAGELGSDRKSIEMGETSKDDRDIYKQSRLLIQLDIFPMDESNSHDGGELLKMVGDWDEGTLKKSYIKIYPFLKMELILMTLIVQGKLIEIILGVNLRTTLVKSLLKIIRNLAPN